MLLSDPVTSMWTLSTLSCHQKGLDRVPSGRAVTKKVPSSHSPSVEQGGDCILRCTGRVSR